MIRSTATADIIHRQSASVDQLNIGADLPGNYTISRLQCFTIRGASMKFRNRLHQSTSNPCRCS